MPKKSTLLYDRQLEINVGVLTEFQNNPKTSYAMEYSNSYLQHAEFFNLDPDLHKIPGSQLLTHFPATLKDSSPDNFGRKLWQKAHPNNHSELDLSLSINNAYRKGSIELGGSSISEVKTLREAEELMRTTTTKEVAKKLLDIGSSSLGGARPKTTITHNGELYVAKFPPPDDRYGGARDEHVATKYLETLGIPTPQTQVKNQVFLSKRFDRIGEKKVGFISLATYLGVDPTDTHDYIDVLDALELADKIQMFKQIVAHTIIHNADDHLNNYGMLRQNNQWKLSPAYDVNAVVDIDTLHSTHLNGESSYAGFMKRLPEVAKYLSIGKDAYDNFLEKAFYNARTLVFTHVNMESRLACLIKYRTDYSILVTPPNRVRDAKSNSHCNNCGRKISSPISLQTGLGPKCRNKNQSA